MIEKINEDIFKKAYCKFRRTEQYKKRKEQLAFLEITERILKEVLKKEEISDVHLTALIQMFKNNCKKETFNKYLEKLDLSQEVADFVLNKFEELSSKEITGFTGQGKTAIKNLEKENRDYIKNTLKNISEAKTKKQIKEIVDDFDSENIPQVTSGIYSPWMYYLQPTICPLAAGKIKDFLSEIMWDRQYSSLIDFFDKLKGLVGEEDLGLIDAFFLEDERGRLIRYAANENKSKEYDLSLVKKQLILYGPPGTGKTYKTLKIAVKLLQEV